MTQCPLWMCRALASLLYRLLPLSLKLPLPVPALLPPKRVKIPFCQDQLVSCLTDTAPYILCRSPRNLHLLAQSGIALASELLSRIVSHTSSQSVRSWPFRIADTVEMTSSLSVMIGASQSPRHVSLPMDKSLRSNDKLNWTQASQRNPTVINPYSLEYYSQ